MTRLRQLPFPCVFGASSHLCCVAQNPDEKLLFKGNRRAAKLNEEAKRIVRLEKRKQWWDANKPKPKSDE